MEFEAILNLKVTLFMTYYWKMIFLNLTTEAHCELSIVEYKEVATIPKG